MPADYTIDRERRRVLSSGTGIYTMEDALDHMGRLVKDPDFDPSFTQLLDFRGITEIALTHEQIFDLATRSVFAPDAKRAFVTASPVQYGLVRMFQTYRSAKGERGIQVFKDLETAVRWLDGGGPAEPGLPGRPPAA